MGGKQLGFSDYELTTAKKQTLTQGLLVLLVATQIPVTIHYVRPLVDEMRYDVMLKREANTRAEKVKQLAEIHCTEAAIGKRFAEQKRLMGSVSFGAPESRAACLKRMEFLADNPN
jgi:hypothetical protein